MIAIVDYGMGNLRSVQKGFEKAGWAAAVVKDASEISMAAGVVLPGVGAFANAMENLKNAGLVGAILQSMASGKPFLGICLGVQLLFEASEEWGWTAGLGILPGTVRRLPESLKVPHMGWNQVFYRKECPLMKGIKEGSYFYFVHSYYTDAQNDDQIYGVSEYAINFACIVGKENIFGIQFHPEKSSAAGLQILHNFGELVAKNDSNSRG